MVQSMLSIDVEDYAEKNAIFINFANLMHAEIFIRFPQFQVNKRHSLFKHTIFHLRNIGWPLTQADSGNKFLVVQPYDFADAYKFMATSQGKQLLAKLPALPALMTAYQKQNTKIMPCYGYTLLHHDSPQNLISLLVGARYAQLKSQANYSIILPFFGELDSLALMQIEQTLRWARSTALRAAIQTLELKSAVTLVSLEDEVWEHVDVASVVGEYILSAQDPTSSLSNYFKNLSLQVQDPQNDRIMAGLTLGVEQLDRSPGWQYTDIVSGEYFPVVEELPHCGALSTTLLEFMTGSLPLLFFMIVLARKIYVTQEIKYHNVRQTLFGETVSAKDQSTREYALNESIKTAGHQPGRSA
jgi:hypothetical protein